MFQGGDWPYFEDPDSDPEQVVLERLNCQRLVSLLEKTGDSSVELYGAWDGGNGGLDSAPEAHETIRLEAILEPGFRFKERGFYTVLISSQ
jgi:hypothetical protein